jgi:PAS domain S-box-containing protein
MDGEDRSENRRSTWARTFVEYGTAFAAVGLGFAVRRAIEWAGAPGLPTYITFYPSLMVVALAFGFGPGLASTVVAALVTDYFILEPRGSLIIESTTDAVGLALFLGMGTFMSVVAELYRRAKQQAEAYERGQIPAGIRVSPHRGMKQGLLVFAGVGVSLALMGGVTWLFHRDIAAMLDADRQTVRSYVVIDELDLLLSSLMDAETGQRGYLITGEESYLEPYKAALGAVEQRLASLRVLAQNRPSQLERLNRIESLAADKLAELKETIGIRQTRGFASAKDAVSTNRGKRIMDDLLGQVRGAHKEEERALKQRTQEKDERIQSTLRVMMVGGLLAFMLLVSVFSFLKVENDRRMRVEEELLVHRDHLQELVSSRTTELAQANTRLKIEAEEHRQARELLRRQTALLDLSPDGIMGRKLDGTITYWSSGAEALYGWTKEEALGKSTHEILKTRFPIPLEEVKRCVMQNGRWTGELVHVAKDGREIVVQSRWMAERTPSGKVEELLESNVDITARRQAEEELRQAHDKLEVRVQERTAALSRAIATLHEEAQQRSLVEQALRHRSEQLQQLAAELTLTEQRERLRLAEVLHDGLQQILVAAKYRIALLQRVDHEDARKAAVDLVSLMDDAIRTSRHLTAELSPPILHEGGIVAAMDWLARWMHENYGLTLSVDVRGKFVPVAEEVLVLLFQAVRELLLNVVKYAGVKEARAELSSEDSWVRIVVEDKGMGFDPAHLRGAGGTEGGFGMMSIRERLNLLGGRMEVDSAPGRGSRISLVAPIALADNRSRAPRHEAVVDRE